MEHDETLTVCNDGGVRGVSVKGAQARQRQVAGAACSAYVRRQQSGGRSSVQWSPTRDAVRGTSAARAARCGMRQRKEKV
jgi:hypothetical protein